MEQRVWWSDPIADIFAFVRSSPNGLTTKEAKSRLLGLGPNTLYQHTQTTLVTRFITKLTNPLILLLLGAASLSALVGQVSDFFIISVIALVSICLDVYQEHAADTAAQELRKRVAVSAKVLRDGQHKEIFLTDLAPGDVVLLGVGDIVPADGRLTSSRGLLVDQSMLTGESFPATKDSTEALPKGGEMVDAPGCVLLGSTVIGGEGTMLVVATGLATLYGHIAKDLSRPRPKTAFETGITKFGYLLLYTALLTAGTVLIFHIILHRDMLSSLLFILALAIGFAPELMPLVITINLSKGALRMSKKEVIVKYLPAIENLGSMDTLCTDKTGTLTENTITLEGSYDPFGHRNFDTLTFGYINSLLQAGFQGPMEEAILKHSEHSPSENRLIDAIPFDFFRKRVSVVVARAKEHMLITKGAPEEVIAISTHFVREGKTEGMTDAIRRSVQKQFTMFSKNGLRTLAVSVRSFPTGKKAYGINDETDLTFVGFLTFNDPPKASAALALARLSRQGITTKILTGDNEFVSEKVCRDLGLPIAGTINGKDLERMSPLAFIQAVETNTIFARLNPEMKKKIIGVLRAQGHVVGFLGDGVNDAPSLHTADIGISVNNATDIAKESADFILLRKDLGVLSDGITEGRKTFANVMKYLKMSISSNFGNMMSVVVASILLPFLPMLPVQILLNDLLYDASQLFLASDTVDSEDLGVPRKWDIGAVKKFMVVFGPISSLFDFLTFGILLYVFRANPALFQTGWFLESLLTQVVIIFSIRTNRVPFWRSRPSGKFALSLLLVVVAAVLLPFSPLGKAFSFVPMPPLFFGMLLLLITGYTILVEAAKVWFYRKHGGFITTVSRGGITPSR